MTRAEAEAICQRVSARMTKTDEYQRECGFVVRVEAFLVGDDANPEWWQAELHVSGEVTLEGLNTLAAEFKTQHVSVDHYPDYDSCGSLQIFLTSPA